MARQPRCIVEARSASQIISSHSGLEMFQRLVLHMQWPLAWVFFISHIPTPCLLTITLYFFLLSTVGSLASSGDSRLDPERCHYLQWKEQSSIKIWFHTLLPTRHTCKKLYLTNNVYNMSFDDDDGDWHSLTKKKRGAGGCKKNNNKRNERIKKFVLLRIRHFIDSTEHLAAACNGRINPVACPALTQL